MTPPRLDDPAAFAATLDAALDAGDVASLQLRLKDVDDASVLRAAETLLPVTRGHDVALIMNDRPDLAAKSGCDGVHIGQQDAPYDEARALVGPDRVVGVTCHNSRHLAMVAAEQGADYVAFGAFFASTTKDETIMAGLDLLEWWSELMVVPSVAIGGITVANCRPLVEAGADFLAVSAGVWAYPDGPAAAVRAFNAAMR